MEEIEILQAQGKSINNADDHWSVLCPRCEKEYEYQGFFDSSEITKCSCGCRFITTKVYFDDNSYME